MKAVPKAKLGHCWEEGRDSACYPRVLGEVHIRIAQSHVTLGGCVYIFYALEKKYSRVL